jgi:flavin reductase (DIM6/NTAB) family NADH-FMN oxidoreductase RutF
VTRVDFEPGDRPGGLYRLLNSVVVPRPIAWVSTRSVDGVDNLAPHSFFTVACADPAVVQFTSIGRKDSLANATATDFPPDHDEFAEVGLEREPSRLVAPPRVAGSPVALECLLHGTKDLGTSVVVFGRVVLVAIEEDVLVDGHPAIERLRPLARLGRRQWSTIGEVREIGRIKFRDWTGRRPDDEDRA